MNTNTHTTQQSKADRIYRLMKANTGLISWVDVCNQTGQNKRSITNRINQTRKIGNAPHISEDVLDDLEEAINSLISERKGYTIKKAS